MRARGFALRLVCLGVGVFLTTNRVRAAEAPPTPEQVAFFEKSIRPVLVKECYSCHSAKAEQLKGKLKLDSRDDLRKGGETGPAVVLGDPQKSLLIQAIKHVKEELSMPPKKKLPETVVADFEKWIAMGAPDPRDTADKAKKYVIDLEKGRKFWAFQPLQQPTLPAVKNAAWAKGAIDRFLLAELEAKGLKPVADADARTLLRRLSFDLIGLPPSPEDVETFVKEYAANPQTALETVVDRLLAVAAVRRALGPPLARRRPLCRVERPIRQLRLSAMPGATATMSSTRSTRTSRMTSSSASSWPATCCPRRTTGRRPNSSSPPASWPSAPRRTTNGTRSSSRWTWRTSRST